MDYSPPSFSVHGILQERILECVDIPFFKGASWPRHWTQVSCIAGRFFAVWATSCTADLKLPNYLFLPFPPGKSKLCLCLQNKFKIYRMFCCFMGFSCSTAGKESLQSGRPGFTPCIGKIPQRRERLPILVFWPAEFCELSPGSRKELDTTEWFSDSLFFTLLFKGLTKVK